MLRITICERNGAPAIALEGRLTCDGVPCVLDSWTRTGAEGRSVTLDLSGVLAVDGPGRQLLVQMHNQGVRLTGSGIAIRGLIEEITGAPP